MNLKSLVLSSLLAGAAFAVQGAGAATIERTAGINLVDDGVGGFNAHFGDNFAASTVNDTFTDVFTFQINRPFDAAASLTSVYLNTPQTKDLSFSGFSLYRYDPNTHAIMGNAIAGIDESGFGSHPTDSWSLEGYGLAGGYYAIQVDGKVRGAGGGTFGADLTVSPVPEPQAWGMLAAGVGVLGAFARRRKSRRA